jgi:hypothetical protein
MDSDVRVGNCKGPVAGECESMLAIGDALMPGAKSKELPRATGRDDASVFWLWPWLPVLLRAEEASKAPPSRETGVLE